MLCSCDGDVRFDAIANAGSWSSGGLAVPISGSGRGDVIRSRQNLIDGAARHRPRVSVVLPTYARPGLVAVALATAQAQTYGDWELLIVDDNGRGSHDQRRTEEAVRRATDDPRVVYLVRAMNGGGGAARNTGIEHARGELVAFLDDDDRWHVSKLEVQVACFDASPTDVVLVYGAYRTVGSDGTVKTFTPPSVLYGLTDLLRGNPIGTTSLVLCRREALIAVGGFDDRLRARQDIDLYVRLAKHHPFAFVEQVLVDKVEHEGDSITKDHGAILESFEIFYRKFRSDFDGDRDAHHAYLYRFGEKALRAGRHAEARSLLWRAWRLRPSAIRALALSLVAFRPLMVRYRRWRRPRTAPQPAHER